MVHFTDTLAEVEASAGVLDAIVEVERMLAILSAAKLDLIRAAHTARVGSWSHALAEREFRAELAAALRISERGASMLIDEADILAEHLPATREALAEGRVTPRQSRILIDELGGLDAEERADLERRALGAAEQSATAFARTVKRMRETRDPETAVERHRRARDARCVSHQPGRDGMAWFVAHLEAADSVAIDGMLDDLARGLARDGDPRTVAQLRADALVDLLLNRDSRTFERFAGIRPTVLVTVPITALAGADDEFAELVGYGPIDAATARQLAAGAPVLRRMITDPRDDAILALGRTRYRMTEDQRLWLTVRDARCRFPSCSRRTAASDIDHGRAWAAGGTTDTANLAHLCRGHHSLKHESAWRLEAIHPDGTLDWLSPTGRRHRTRPAHASGPEPP